MTHCCDTPCHGTPKGPRADRSHLLPRNLLEGRYDLMLQLAVLTQHGIAVAGRERADDVGLGQAVEAVHCIFLAAVTRRHFFHLFVRVAAARASSKNKRCT